MVIHFLYILIISFFFIDKFMGFGNQICAAIVQYVVIPSIFIFPNSVDSRFSASNNSHRHQQYAFGYAPFEMCARSRDTRVHPVCIPTNYWRLIENFVLRFVIAFVYGCGISCLYDSQKSASTHTHIACVGRSHSIQFTFSPFPLFVSLLHVFFFIVLVARSHSLTHNARSWYMVLGTPYGKRATVHQHVCVCTPTRRAYERDIIFSTRHHASYSHTCIRSHRIPLQGVRKGHTQRFSWSPPPEYYGRAIKRAEEMQYFDAWRCACDVHCAAWRRPKRNFHFCHYGVSTTTSAAFDCIFSARFFLFIFRFEDISFGIIDVAHAVDRRVNEIRALLRSFKWLCISCRDHKWILWIVEV